MMASEDPEAEGGERADRGSITPLAIGFVIIALLLALLIAALTDLHMARRELQAVADSAALAASDSFEPAPGDEPGLVFSRLPPNAQRSATSPPCLCPTICATSASTPMSTVSIRSSSASVPTTRRHSSHRSYPASST